MSRNESGSAYVVEPVLETPRGATFALEGYVADRLDANVRSWLLPAPRANPAMLQMFRDRDNDPPRDLLPWSGEFVGEGVGRRRRRCVGTSGWRCAGGRRP